MFLLNGYTFMGRNSAIFNFVSSLNRTQLLTPPGANSFLNPIAIEKAKIVCNFGLSECNRVKE